jgi:hypothetical protein
MARSASTLDGSSFSGSAPARLSDALSSVRDVLGGLDETLAAADAEEVAALVGGFDALSRSAGAGWARSARRAAELEVHSASGHRNAADWLAQQSGVSFAKAKEALGLADRLESSAPVKDAFDRGELTISQAATIADALDVAPGSGESLLKTAQDGTHQELSQHALRVKQAARSRDDELKRRARAFLRRSLRFTQLPEGGVRVQAYLTDEAWGRCLARIDARAKQLFRLGRSAKVHATLDQYRADALVDFVAGIPTPNGDAQVETFGVDESRDAEDASSDKRGNSSGGAPGGETVDPTGDATGEEHEADLEGILPVANGDAGGGGGSGTRSRRGFSPASVTVIVRVDAAALRRGWVEPGEMCEIAGVGPVSVDTARELLGEWYVRLLVTDGTDVTTITGRHRHVPARVEAALFERDLSCVVPHCGVTIGLETHHWQVEVRSQGPTVLDNLCRLCSVHHDMASNAGWTIRGGPGHWEWVGPDWPVSTQLRQTRRRIAASRGRSPGD